MDATEQLRRIPFLAGLPGDELDRLAATLRRRKYRRNEVIFHQDDPGNGLFIVASGSVKIVRRSEAGRELILSMAGPTNYFGELSVLDGEPRSADAIAVEASELLILAREALLKVIETTPAAAIILLASLSRDYVRRLTDVVEGAAFLDVAGRLSLALLRLADGASEVPPAIRLTQTDLASMVGATRESANKWLGFFERQGWVKRNPGGLVVLDREALARQSSRS